MSDAPELEGLETLRAELRGRQGAAEGLLGALVDEPSGSENRDGIARVLERLAREAEGAGVRVDLLEDGGLPRHLHGRLTGVPEQAPRVVLIGHCDTVFPVSDRRRLTSDEHRFYGPGCADMKGGLVILLEALRACAPYLRAAGLGAEVIINGDEELGSPASRALIRERAAGALAALVFENCDEDGAVILGRKGLGRAKIAIEGKAAHAGVAPEKGASAVVEMARQILDISALAVPERALHVTVGLAKGGISRNTVPPHAELEVDLRFEDAALAEDAFAKMRDRGSRTTVPGTRSRFEGELHRPPMRRESPHQEAMLALLGRASCACGRTSPRALVSGGGSDANHTADLGIPTADGLGVIGSAIHTKDEWCLRRSLEDRALLTAALLRLLAEGALPLSRRGAVG